MYRFFFGSVELAVHNSRARRHGLDGVRPYDSPIAHVVLVREAAFENVSDDLHVAVGMRAESPAGSDAILVHDAQRAESHVRGIVVIPEGKSMPGFAPAVVPVAAFATVPDGDHISFSLHSNETGIAAIITRRTTGGPQEMEEQSYKKHAQVVPMFHM